MSSSPDMHQRSHHCNYHAPHTYMLTLTTEGDNRLFGHIAGASEEEAHLVPTPLGAAVKAAWLTLPARYPNIIIRPDEITIMPEHLHAIIHTNAFTSEHLSDIEKTFKSNCNNAYKLLLIENKTRPIGTATDWIKAFRNLPPDQQQSLHSYLVSITAHFLNYDKDTPAIPGSIPTINQQAPPFKVISSGSHPKTGFLFRINYNDTITLDAEQYEHQRNYIRTNISVRYLREHNTDLLFVKHSTIDTLVTIPALLNYLRQECPPYLFTDENISKLTSWLIVNDKGHICCDSFGDLSIISRPCLPIVCHRKDAYQQSKQLNIALDKAQQGHVMVSASIAQGEQLICRTIYDNHLPLVYIDNNGFPNKYHPTAEKLHACQHSLLLIITPWHYRYGEDIYQLSCKTMNCIAQALCKTKDTWWKAQI